MRKRDLATLARIVGRNGRRAVAQAMLDMPNELPRRRARPSGPRDGAERRISDVGGFHFVEKQLLLMVAEGADEGKAHRAASELVAMATGLNADVVRRKHRLVARTLTNAERADYRRSLFVVGWDSFSTRVPWCPPEALP